MTLPDALSETLEQNLGHVRRVGVVGGGCIANAARVDTAGGAFFLKWGRGDVGATIEAEAAGLRVLRAAVDDELRIPEVVLAGEVSREGLRFLALEFIEQGSPGRETWQSLGRGLARMHRVEGEAYGFERDNFIGRLPQANEPLTTWPDFYRRRRLLPQIEMARERGRWEAAWDDPAERLLSRLEDILPHAPARSVLHGDLWSGNALVDRDGRPVLIDPAAYHGDRETDLAMMTLFGGFDRAVFGAYEAEWPLESGWQERRTLYQLYHILNHLNHFGPSYSRGVDEIVRRY